ncbi:PxKF domain-containing protein [Arthrobacter sp. SAFR-179]|uniref:PxKF domain-containing protein n=1 Tax=Arthrobacter sp. SAFR-179 TaxID=3387279 RepID=UPI003F7BB31A
MNHSPSGKTTAGGTGLLRRTSTRTAAAVAAGSLLLAGGGVAFADDIYNKLDADIDATAEIMPLNVGGVSGSTTLAVDPTNGDGKSGCNLTGSTTLTLNLASSNPAVATVSPSSVTFTSCGDTKSLTISPVGAGSATVSASQASNNTGGTFNLAPATFAVNVAAPAPSNTAPVLNITGVTNGGTYTKGKVPEAVCDVTDAEDGHITFDPDLSDISGNDAATGIGSLEAICSYTDKGGLTATNSVTYSIIDGSAPTIGYTLSPSTPDGDNGWYKTAVKLHWIVTEEDSPSTLDLTGCEDQEITADQVATDYSCSVTSSGGDAPQQTVNLGKDQTAPTVAADGADGVKGSNDWYISDVKASFTGTDATSGLLAATQTVTSSGESANVKVDSPAFTDIAGNTTLAGAASQTFKIDKTAPEVSYTSAAGTEGNNGWYRSNVTATFTGTDATSGPATPTQTATSDGEGAAVTVESPDFSDNAGNTTPAGAASQTFKIDKTAPAVSFDSVIADGYFGSTAAKPTCTASDTLSGVSGSCVVSGYDTGVGLHTLTATATDLAGNSTTVEQTYTVKAWTLKGFYQPVDMNGVLNTVKNGSTVPAKFEIFAGDTELTDPSLAKFTAKQVACSLLSPIDDIETTATGNTSLRYDATSGQFIYNWKTPAMAGSCYTLTMTANDGSSISANFKLK